MRRTFATLTLALFLIGSGTHALQAQTILVSTGAVWKYLDTGSDLGAAWREVVFLDLDWAFGPAPLGYGDGDEATVVNGGPATDRFITTYFRHTFVVADAAGFTNLLVKLLRDDGGAVYLNGTEIFRSNLPTNVLTASTLAMVNVPARDESTNFYPNAVSPSLLVDGLNLLAVEIHQVATDSTDHSFDLELVGNFTPVPPTVQLTSPVGGALITTANLTINATASGSEGTILRVEYFAGNNKLGESATAPHSLTWSNVPAGAHILTAAATDSSGLTAVSAPVDIRAPTLIPRGSTWKYLDDGSDQGAVWRELAFDDSLWLAGPAELGYGDGNEATLLNGGPATERFVTTYFRRAFDSPDPTGITNLILRLLRDDGGVVYLNGTEVFRSNLPEGPVTSATLAATTVGDATTFYATNINPALLAAGPNSLAVEIHQVLRTSSDVSFNLELLFDIPPVAPVINVASPSNNALFTAPATVIVNANATDFDGLITRVEFYYGVTKVGEDATEPYAMSYPALSAGPYTFWAATVDDAGLISTSAPVQITVLSPPVVTTLVATGSVWRYLDNGSNQGTEWVAPGFDDSGWSSGMGKFGTNDSPVTVIQLGPSSGRYFTTYFRTSFSVDQAGRHTNLAFRVLRDDGVVTYLNGSEIFRMNMPSGPITYTTPASSAVGGASETNYFPTNISANLLVSGTNVLAVELHQTAGTTDAGFDLGLYGLGSPVTDKPVLSVDRSDTEIVIRWAASGFVLEQAAAIAGPWTEVAPPLVSPHTLSTSATAGFYRLRQP